MMLRASVGSRKIARKRCSTLVAALAWLAASPSALAQGGDSGMAESLYRDAIKLMEQSRYEQACPKLVESQRIDPATGTLVALAKCYEGSGKTASAWSTYQDLAFAFKRDNKVDGEAAAKKKIDDLEKRLSKLRINVEKDSVGLVIRRDDEALSKAALGTPIPVDPGKHRIEATAPGYETWQTTITIEKEGTEQTVLIPALKETSKPENTGLRTASFVTGGVGVLSLGVGAAFGIMAASDKSDLEDECPGQVCTSSAAKDRLSSAKTKAWVSTVGFGVGGAALATGIVLFLLSNPQSSAPKEQTATTRLVPILGPGGGSLNLIGAF